MMTKYNFTISKSILQIDKKRLINQLWKILPMREKEEEWQKQLRTVIYEIIGLSEILKEQVDFLILLSKLESLFQVKEFSLFRKTIFESINLLDGLMNE